MRKNILGLSLAVLMMLNLAACSGTDKEETKPASNDTAVSTTKGKLLQKKEPFSIWERNIRYLEK